MLSLRWLAVPVQSRFYLEFVYFSGSFINKASFRPNYLVYIESWLHLWNIVIEIPGTVTISVGVCMLVACIITCLPVQKKLIPNCHMFSYTLKTFQTFCAKIETLNTRKIQSTSNGIKSQNYWKPSQLKETRWNEETKDIRKLSISLDNFR